MLCLKGVAEQLQKVEFFHVRAHMLDPLNKEADRMARGKLKFENNLWNEKIFRGDNPVFCQRRNVVYSDFQHYLSEVLVGFVQPNL